MIVICNGAFKSGSTWILNIARRLSKPERIPEKWQNPKWNSPSIDPVRLKGFIKSHKGGEETYVSKNHLDSRRAVKLLTRTFVDDVKVLNIRRDIRDVVISAYHHYKRVNDYDEEFDAFFEKKGWKVAKRVSEYNELWDTGTPNNHFTSYEALHTDGVEEISRIAKFMELDPTTEEIERVREATTFGAWKEKTGSKHLRKGVIGDWKNYLSEEQVAKLRSVVPAADFSPLSD